MPGSGSSHSVEELFLDDLAVVDGVEGGFFHGEAFALHGAGFGGDVEAEEDDEAVAVGPGALGDGTVNFMVGVPPLSFFHDGCDAFAARVLTCRGAGLDADDVG